ncbi:hypothetical protein CPC16_009231 [Podila verticillata]|nr:hypothetical protein CPC16_009231 [Podila verticillata]
MNVIDLWSLPVCARVNNEWNGIVTLLIWNTFDIRSDKQGELFMRIETQLILAQNAGNLHDIYIDLDNMMVFKSIVNGARIRALCQKPQHVAFSIHGRPSFSDLELDISTVEPMVAPRLPAHRKIVFHGVPLGFEMLLALLRSCSELTTFEISSIEPFRDNTVQSELAKLGSFLDCIHSSELPRYRNSKDSEIAVTIALSLGT